MNRKQWNYTITMYTGSGSEIEKVNITGTGDYSTPDESLLIWSNDGVIFQTNLK